ncbi:MAG: M10 family metallopeptidase C-terminal domain-containing protein [Aphanocapsa sp. GSE-SYN-MK-11-07L]|jgi:Ca2+-binding RTX toxin-like protein|nr:M10 family metallopeptidase C-terminal domain-containing protein [Aphanocapsa sp. GSE-SYN-MK-11-07L]
MASQFNLIHLPPELDESNNAAQLISHTPVKEKTEKQPTPELGDPEHVLSTATLPVQPASVGLTRDQSLNLAVNPIAFPGTSPSGRTAADSVASATVQPPAPLLTSYFPLNCSCPVCQGSTQGSSGSSTAQNASAAASADQRIDTLLGEYKWGVTSLTYSFYAGGPFYGSETGLATVSDAVKTNLRFILQNVVSPLINIDFVEVADSPSSYGQIRYLNSTSPSYAYAYYPYSTDANQGNSSDLAGDVFLNPSYDNSNDTNGFQGGIGNHGYLTLIHETLHALGLKHPGDYNGSGSGDGPFLPFNQDNFDNTIMTYNFTSTTAGSPMAYDVLALQSLYGARSFNPDNTTYSFNSLFGYSDGTRSVGSTTTETKLTLWDSGGTDTFNFSGLGAGGYYFDLNPGGWLTNTATLNSQTYTARSDTSGINNTVNGAGTRIGFGVTVENAIGTASNDTLLGNDADNRFSSGGGNDYLVGGGGNDTLIGGLGNDALTGNAGNDFFLYATGAAYAAGAIGVDRLTDFGRAANNTDKIVLSRTTFTAGTSFDNVTTDALAATSGAFITFSIGTGNLFYNQNGAEAGFGSGGQFAAVGNVSSLVETDFTTVA